MRTLRLPRPSPPKARDLTAQKSLRYRGWQVCVDAHGNEYLGAPGGPRDDEGFYSNGIFSSAGESASLAARKYNAEFLDRLLPDVAVPPGYTFARDPFHNFARSKDCFDFFLSSDDGATGPRGELQVCGPDGEAYGTDRIFMRKDGPRILKRMNEWVAWMTGTERVRQLEATAVRDSQLGWFLERCPA